MHTFTVPIGDWSKDGHNQHEEFRINSSHSADECRAAYIASCKLTGVQFHRAQPHQQPYNPKGDVLKGTAVLVDYEDGIIPGDVVKTLQDHGLDVIACLEDFPEDDWEDEGIGCGPKELTMILMQFISLSMPADFVWEFIKKDEYLFGFWNKDLNISVGYGIFYG